MAINPAVSTVAVHDDIYKAVVPVDIKFAPVPDPTVVSAYAAVVVIDSSTPIVTSGVVTQPTAANLNAQVVGNIAAGATDSGNPVKMGGRYNTTQPTLTDGQRGDAQLGSRGSLRVQLAAPDSTSSIIVQGTGTDGLSNSITAINTGAFGLVFNGTTWDRNKKATTTGRIVSSAATTNATSVKASAGSVHGFTATNTTAALKYLKFYNKASAPTVGTDTPIWTQPLQPSNVPTTVRFPKTLNFSTGIAIALTGAAADADTTALAAGDVVGLNIAYD